MTNEIRSALATEAIEPGVPRLGGQAGITVEESEVELTQAIRRLNRAVIAAKIEAGMKAGKPSVSTPLTDELLKMIGQLENIRLAYNLKDKEVPGGG